MTGRKVIVYLAMSLDGYIARKNHDLDWLLAFNSSDEDYGYNDFIKTVDVVIMGRITYYKILAMGYQYPHGERKYFVWTNIERQSEGNVSFYTGSLPDLVLDLKAKPGGNIYVDGSAVINELMKYYLIDEYIISIIPIVLGDGIRLFKGGLPEEHLAMQSVKSFESGLVQIHYKSKSK